MFEKLSFIEQQHEELAAKISDPAVMTDMDNWRKLCKEHSDITPIVEKYREYKALNENIDEAKEMLADSSLDKEEKSYEGKSRFSRYPTNWLRVSRRVLKSISFNRTSQEEAN